MTSRFLWLFLFILLEAPTHHAASMNFRRILMTFPSNDLNSHGSNERRIARDVGGQNNANKQDKENNTDVGNTSNKELNMTAIDDNSPLDVEVVSEATPGLKECDPCVILPGNSGKRDGDEIYHPNLTIIPMGGVFMFIVCLVIRFIHWCNEDIRLADERYMKISIPPYIIMSDSPMASPSLPHHHPHHSHPHRRVHRRSSVSAANVKLMQKAIKHHTTDDDTTTNPLDTSESEDTTVIYNVDSKPRRPVVPNAAAAGTSAGGGGSTSIGKSMSQKLGLTRSPNRYLRRQSLNSSSNTTLSSSMSSSRSPSMRNRTISFQEEEEEEEERRLRGDSKSLCGSSSMSPGQSSLDVTPLLFRQHSTPSNETPFAQRKTLAFRTHLLTPPLLHFQVSRTSSGSADTSMTSLGESMPSFASRPSVCESTLTEQEVISEDGESLNGRAAHSPRPLSANGGGLMLLTGTYNSDDPLIIQCSYLEVDETSEPTVFTLGSPTPSNGSDDAPLTPAPDGESPGGEDMVDDNDGHRGDHEPTMDNMEESDSSSDCNSESELTAHEGGYPRNGTPSSASSDQCSHSSVGATYHRTLDPALYYKLSMESNESTGSLQSPESMQSDSTSLCSSEVALVRRAGPSSSTTAAAFRALGHNVTGRTAPEGRPVRRERISLNGFGYLSQHSSRRIQNGKVMRMCRSWCLGDKASAIYGQVRRGLQEKECYM